MNRKKFLDEHPYKIWQGPDGRWKTKINMPTGLKQLKKTRKEDLENAIVSHYVNANKVEPE